MAGRQTGIRFGVANLDAEYRRLSALGVKFTMKPERQPWGGYISMFADPEGNLFYLDELKKES
jgi:predicted enzyme related to lactoylglutathione lyase